MALPHLVAPVAGIRREIEEEGSFTGLPSRRGIARDAGGVFRHALMPDLDAASDTGWSATDNRTSDTTPTFTIQAAAQRR